MKQKPVVGIVKNLMPAVVSIAITKSLEILEKEVPKDLQALLPYKDGHLQIPEEMVGPDGKVKIGGGSGFIVHPSGIIVTNKHVVQDKEAEYTVILDSGEKFTAEILARDPVDDVAIMKITTGKKKLPTIPLGDSSKVELGEEVLAIGNALGIFKNTVSKGIISGLARSIRAASEMGKKPQVQELRGLIQTDAAINPGNSGGPLVHMDGRAIGINAAIVFGAQNLGFAIPINYVKRDLEDLKTHGRIRRPLLGLRYLTIDDMLQKRLGLPVAEGALIMGEGPHAKAIIAGTPAERAGLKPKDIIVAVNGKKLSQDVTIQDFLEEREVGDTLAMQILRNGKEFNANVVLAERK
jgi:S1-C subfamily serine protease